MSKVSVALKLMKHRQVRRIGLTLLKNKQVQRVILKQISRRLGRR